ncbi:hypothetical protein MNBD_BACTEROID01-782 [hydrothermal vent metagenome]|uniref:Uncharacterized protein n=1 Tax=hydrothermal vent metagenome TaxID=652676 RepID=A0A3B0TFL6_9ZZZZ
MKTLVNNNFEELNFDVLNESEMTMVKGGLASVPRDEDLYPPLEP